MHNIYLVRVRQRADQSLYLEHKPNATTDDDYIAISHVWGTPDTVKDTVVDGHPGVVKLSPGKRDILSILSRPDICGSDWFWMDLFCIDQTESATISIADQLMSIPHVYKSSRCVKVLLEHPICADWHASVMDRLHSHNVHDEDVWGRDFMGLEMDHSVLCGPHMVCFDPWFERLWTRQEGLYGKVLDIVPLNLIPCPREQNRFDREYKKWMYGGLGVKSMAVIRFLHDKLAYHGVGDLINPMDPGKPYVDLVYRRHLDMATYGGEDGPAATYEPLGSAWGSRRTTTKPRDYVLAVFPDLNGYTPPPDMRTMTFPELVTNALTQAPIQQHYRIVPKVLAGMMKDSAAMSLTESMALWMVEEPNDVTEAYDSFTFMPLALWPIKSTKMERLYSVCWPVTVEDGELGRAEVPRILELCKETMNVDRQSALIPSSAPLMGMSRDQMRTEQGRVLEYLWRNFALFDILAAFRQETGQMGNFDDTSEFPEAVFAEGLRRFLVSLICGTSLPTADVILRHASPCVLSTPVGKILAVVHLQEGEARRQTPQVVELLVVPLSRFPGRVADQDRYHHRDWEDSCAVEDIFARHIRV